MLAELRIENFALINEATIPFDSGFTVITGETGSGKSILLNALNLLLGERANFSVIGPDKDIAVVEGVMNLSGFGLEEFFEVNELDYFEQTIVRRVIYKQGRSRAFINDVPVSLQVLKEFSSKLIHIHSQYNTLELKDADYQMEVLDVLADTFDSIKSYQKQFQNLQNLRRSLKSNKEKLANEASMADYNAFQLNELSEIDLKNKDFKVLQDELNAIENAEDLKAMYSQIMGAVESDNGLLDNLNELKAALSKKKNVLSEVGDLFNRFESLIVELIDINETARDQLDNISMDPEKQEILATSLDTYNNLLFKHKKSSQEELIDLMEELENSFNDNSELQKLIHQQEEEIIDLSKSLHDLASQIHSKRVKSAGKIEDLLKNALSDLKLIETELEFKLSEREELNQNGLSDLSILFSPNRGIQPVPIHQAASGGELSRVMLALQSLISERIQLRTVLFDEIDTGVSGDVASKVAQTLLKMGKSMQVIAITHLPQVAAKGASHLKVYKSLLGDRTISQVKSLNESERIEEVASLMSGDKINQAALDNAKSLMA